MVGGQGVLDFCTIDRAFGLWYYEQDRIGCPGAITWTPLFVASSDVEALLKIRDREGVQSDDKERRRKSQETQSA